MIGRIEREDLFIFKDDDIDADRGVNFLKFWNVWIFERKLQVSNIEKIKVFAVVIEPVWVSFNSMDVDKNGPEQTIIVVLILDIDNAHVTQRFWCLDK